MTEKFNNAIPHIFEHEGGFNDVKFDKGGATNWGISLRFLESVKVDVNGDGLINWLDIKALTKDHATELYYLNFWKNYYETFPQRLATKLFDMSVNMGSSRANKILQEALNALGSNIPIDGMIGRGTLGEVVKFDEKTILGKICTMQSLFYTSIIDRDPTQKKFQKGWENRAYWLPK